MSAPQMPGVGAPERILAALLEAKAGHAMTQERMWRIETALQPVLRQRNLPTLEALVVALASDDDRVLLDTVVEALINHETYFFRDFELFCDIERVALRHLREQRMLNRRLNIWSLGCSTGQEPYSLAMQIADNPDIWTGWNIQIVATDISSAVIQTARQGRYSQFEVQRGLPARQMLHWFKQEGDSWQVDRRIRDMVRFQTHNILTDPLPVGPFDMILCRNVLFYLTAGNRMSALGRIAGALSRDGLFMLGAFETVLGQGQLFHADTQLKGFYRPGNGAIRPRNAA